MKENNKENNTENTRDFGLLALVFLVILYRKYGEWVQAKLQEPYSLVLLGLAVALALGLLWCAGHYIEKLRNRFNMWRLGIKPAKDIAFPFYIFNLPKQLKAIYQKGNNLDMTFLGMNAEKRNKEMVTIPDIQRSQHLQILGMTGTGKTSGVFLPLIYQDALKNHPVIILDAKGELSSIYQLNAMLASIGRSDDFLLFSLAYKDISCTYNPLFVGECDPQIVVDAFLSNYQDDNSFYREMSKTIFTNAFYILYSLGKPFTVLDIYAYLTKPSCYSFINKQITDKHGKGMTHLKLLEGLIERLKNQQNGLENVIAGFTNYLFAHQDSTLNDPDSDIVLTDAIRQRKIVYFQLPTNSYPIQAISIARMVQANLRYISSLIQTGQIPKNTLVSIIIDEYASFAEESFVEVLNKARSSGMMVTIAHQSLSDLKAISVTFMKRIDENTLNKIYLQQTDPELCELIAKSMGTYLKEEKTYRMTAGKFGNQIYSGESSNRVVNEFHFPPDKIKNLHKFGQGYFIYRGDNSQKCVNLGHFVDMPELQYKRKEKKNKRDGLRLFEKYYLNSAKPKLAKPEKDNKEDGGVRPHIGD